ncbi:MAG: class I SAM-dependent methyltransferase [Rhodospirillaceae bacterium]|nr:class I SAM-dependent methyltransferase [Rhodospirillaceae bacterium]
MLDFVFRFRARWSARRIRPWVGPADRVLDIGAGDGHLGLELTRSCGCAVTAVDVTDTNRTSQPLVLYDGKTLPFADGSFDVGLLLFVLHHAEDPERLLRDAMRVCRRIVAFEDMNVTARDRRAFRHTHWVLDRTLGIDYPRHEWPPERWLDLARACGLATRWHGPIGRQFGYLSPRHIMYVWEPADPEVRP